MKFLFLNSRKNLAFSQMSFKVPLEITTFQTCWQYLIYFLLLFSVSMTKEKTRYFFEDVTFAQWLLVIKRGMVTRKNTQIHFPFLHAVMSNIFSIFVVSCEYPHGKNQKTKIVMFWYLQMKCYSHFLFFVTHLLNRSWRLS